MRGFHVIVPPEYRSLGCLPPEQFAPALMETLGMPYYAGLLSAAQFHGAAHQRPQVFQVVVESITHSIRRRIDGGHRWNDLLRRDILRSCASSSFLISTPTSKR
jgi:hypothetical protein